MKEEKFLKGFRRHVEIFSKKISYRQMLRNIRGHAKGSLTLRCPFFDEKHDMFLGLGKNGKIVEYDSENISENYNKYLSEFNEHDVAKMIKIIKEVRDEMDGQPYQ